MDSSAPRSPSPRAETAAENLAADEAMLAAGRAAARVGVIRDRAVTVGAGTRLTPSVVERMRAVGLPCLVRGSGGAAVLHQPGDLAWSVVLPRSDVRVGRDFTRSYARFGEPVVRLLAEFGVVGRWAAAPGLSDEYCLLSGRGEVLLVGETVVGGAAQHATARSLLHHGILPWSVDRATVAHVFGIDPSVVAGRLGGWEELPGRPARETVSARLAARLAAWVGASPT